MVNCLRDGGAIRFATASFSANETIRIKNNVSIESVAEGKTTFACNAKPVFEIRSVRRRRPENGDGCVRRRAAAVVISNIAVEQCELDGVDAPLVVGPGATATLRSVAFLNNANGEGASSIKAMAGSSVTIEDSEIRDCSGELGTVVLSNASSLTVRNSTFSDNRVNNSDHGGGVFLIQVRSLLRSSPRKDRRRCRVRRRRRPWP